MVRSFSVEDKSQIILTKLEELHKQEGHSKIHKPEFSQPISTAVQIALVDLLRSFDIHPAVVVGHSSGEIAAAYVQCCESFFASVNKG